MCIRDRKTEVYFNKPVYVGQAILDLSKTLMFDFHYNYIKKKYKDKAELLFTDTDSLMNQIKTDDFYKDIPMTYQPSLTLLIILLITNLEYQQELTKK